MPKPGRPKTRFLNKEYVEANTQVGPQTYEGTPCWNWTGPTTESGYGYGPGGWTVLIHREVKKLYEGHEWRPGEMGDHKCRRKICVNPAHIRVTNRAANKMHQDDFKSGSMAKRRLRISRWMHDTLPERMQKGLGG